MGRRKTPVGQPCRGGHAYEHRGPRGCRACKAARDKQRPKRKGKEKKASRAEIAGGALWIRSAHHSLRSRASGEPRASRQELLALWVAQGGKCALTGLPIRGTPHLDHITPTALGGAHVIGNLQWVDGLANRAKNQYSVAEFRAWLLAAADALRQKIKLEALL